MVSFRNGRGIWNVRAIPRWQILSGVRPASSCAPKRIEPELGVSAPDTQLKRVVLPEPFGPMRPRISPSFTSKETAFSAVKPPKRFVRPVTVNICKWGAPTWPPDPPNARTAPGDPWRSSSLEAPRSARE